MKTLIVVLVVQSLNLIVFWWFNRVAWFRILTLRQQLAVYKRKAKKPGTPEELTFKHTVPSVY